MNINLGRTLSINFNYVSSVEVLPINDCCFGDSFDKVEYRYSYNSVKDGKISHYTDFPFVVHVIMSNGYEHIITGDYAIVIASYFNQVIDIIDQEENLGVLHQSNLDTIKEYEGIDVYSIPDEQYKAIKAKIRLPVFS